MGVALTEILVRKEISIDDLIGKIIVVDAPLWLYQFLSSIRQMDGSLLTDSKGEVTSHLVGLFSRVISLCEKNIKLAFVFDGKPPGLKQQTLQKRRMIKESALAGLQKAEEEGDIEAMKKFAARTSRLTPEMIAEAKHLLVALGIPVIEAPSEAEAQAAHIVLRGDAYALATSDADALMFGSPRIIRNLNMAGKRKRTGKLSSVIIEPELIELSENLTALGISRAQLIALSMLVGTDFNNGGIKGVGPKNAVKLVKKFGSNFEALFTEVKWSEYFSYPWREVYDTIYQMPTMDNYKLFWQNPDEKKVIELLVDNHNFSVERVRKSLDEMTAKTKSRQQKGLGEFF